MASTTSSMKIGIEEDCQKRVVHRNMDATTVDFKVASWSSLTKQNKVSFLSPLTSFLPIKTLRTPPPNQQQKKNKKGVNKHGVSSSSSSHERVMIRRGLNLISCIIRGSSAAGANNNPRIITTTTTTTSHHHRIPKLRDPNHRHRHLRLGCVLTSSSEMADSVNKLVETKEGTVDMKTKGEATPPPPPPAPPSPPEKPLPGDCCGNGCIPCVWDTYNEELEDYNNLLKAYQSSQSKP